MDGCSKSDVEQRGHLEFSTVGKCTCDRTRHRAHALQQTCTMLCWWGGLLAAQQPYNVKPVKLLQQRKVVVAAAASCCCAVQSFGVTGNLLGLLPGVLVYTNTPTTL